MTEPTDHALFVRWRAGDTAAGNELVQRYCAPVLRFFSNKAPNAAEDLMQKTFMGCLAAATPAEEIRSFRGFLFGVARYQLLRFREGRGELRGVDPVTHVSGAAPGTTPTQRVARDKTRDLLRQSIETLPLDQQIAIELFYWQQLTVPEVATALGLSEGGTRAKLHRARQRVRAIYLERSGGETFDWPRTA